MTLEQLIAGAEENAQAAADALLAADPLSLERCSTLLRESAAALAQAAPQGVTDPALAKRLRALGERLSLVRDQLARVCALADRQAATVLPPAEAPTYGGKNGASGTPPRIYRAAG